MNLPAMFRAGSGTRSVAAPAPVVFLADVSEFQPEIADPAYLAWSKAIVIRAMYGDAHDDQAWYGGQRRALLHQGGVRFLGIYQYLVAGQDVAAQARAFVSLVGKLQPGELPICDLEEGSGNQWPRWETWKGIVGDALGVSPWLYSGLAFSASHGLIPEWVAAYGQGEPSVPHLMWQFTGTYDVPGIGTCDCSLFHGTIDHLAAYAYGGKPAPPAPKPEPVPSPVPAWQEALMNALPALSAGAVDEAGHVFYVHRIQALARVVGAAKGVADAASLTIDGDFGPMTAQALRGIQAAFGIPVTGDADRDTWGVLVTGAP